MSFNLDKELQTLPLALYCQLIANPNFSQSDFHGNSKIKNSQAVWWLVSPSPEGGPSCTYLLSK